MPKKQTGRRHKPNTIHGATKLLSDVFAVLNQGSCVGACPLDKEKAVDTVWLWKD